ncbi:hypothetical protein V5N11_020428 [Cardamine amara subsp. amara]|uniref:Endonuclease/exonuclease/phosphatase n=1 Tax=Cardamine amara subsp. amara TaxID=228776 RepID=A0ABD1ASG4_CARAN
MEDFNDILHNGEKKGGPRRGDSAFLPFKDMINCCQVSELSSNGNRFTWGGRRYDLWVQSRLDSCFGNKNWQKTFPASSQTFLEKRGSDHRPILVKLAASQDSYKGSFRFDKKFLNKPMVKEAISLAWNCSNHIRGFSVAERLRGCRKALSKWKKENPKNDLTRINQIQDALEAEQSVDNPRLDSIFIMKQDLAWAYREEEDYWRQKSKEKWLNAGDKNSKFFHNSVKAARRKKRLEKLKDVNGCTQNSEASKGAVAEAYFRDLFKSTNPNDFHGIFYDFSPRVSAPMNRDLIREVRKDEIKEAVRATVLLGPMDSQVYFSRNIGMSSGMR